MCTQITQHFNGFNLQETVGNEGFLPPYEHDILHGKFQIFSASVLRKLHNHLVVTLA